VQEQRLASLQLALEQKGAELAAAKSAQAEAASALAAAQAAASQAAAAAEPARAELAGRAAEAEGAAEAAKAALGRARKEQEAEREKVKKAMGEMKRKLDRCCLQTIFLSLRNFSSHAGPRNTISGVERCRMTLVQRWYLRTSTPGNAYAENIAARMAEAFRVPVHSPHGACTVVCSVSTPCEQRHVDAQNFWRNLAAYSLALRHDCIHATTRRRQLPVCSLRWSWQGRTGRDVKIGC
jgi:hypothetical protein